MQRPLCLVILSLLAIPICLLLFPSHLATTQKQGSFLPMTRRGIEGHNFFSLLMMYVWMRFSPRFFSASSLFPLLIWSFRHSVHPFPHSLLLLLLLLPSTTISTP